MFGYFLKGKYNSKIVNAYIKVLGTLQEDKSSWEDLFMPEIEVLCLVVHLLFGVDALALLIAYFCGIVREMTH